MEYITIIPFWKSTDILSFAKKHNIQKYTTMYLTTRGPQYPEKFYIIIEEDTDFSFPLGGHYFKTLQEVQSFRKEHYKDWRNPSIYWKLINNGYIVFGVNKNEPFRVLRKL